MKRVLLGVVVTLGLSLGVSAQASRWFPGFLAGAVDYEVQTSPCGAAQTLQATPFILHDQVWVTYLCADNRVVMRGFLSMIPGFQIPTSAGVVCPQGFVRTPDQQGCVPPNHPLARAR